MAPLPPGVESFAWGLWVRREYLSDLGTAGNPAFLENHKWVNVVFRTSCELASPRRLVVITCCKNPHRLPGSFHHMLLPWELAFPGSRWGLRTVILHSGLWLRSLGNLQQGREACGMWEVKQRWKDLWWSLFSCAAARGKTLKREAFLSRWSKGNFTSTPTSPRKRSLPLPAHAALCCW